MMKTKVGLLVKIVFFGFFFLQLNFFQLFNQASKHCKTLLELAVTLIFQGKNCKVSTTPTKIKSDDLFQTL